MEISQCPVEDVLSVGSDGNDIVLVQHGERAVLVEDVSARGDLPLGAGQEAPNGVLHGHRGNVSPAAAAKQETVLLGRGAAGEQRSVA